jgi:DNA-binding protein H-NS
MSFVGDVSMQIEALKVMTANRLRIMTEALEVFNQRVNERTTPDEGLEATFENTHSAYFKLYEQTHKYKIQPLVMPVRAKIEAENVNAIVEKYY